MKKLNIFYSLLFFSFILFIFRNWVFVHQIIGGDWPYIFEETFKNYSFYFSSWNPFQGNGFGGMSPFYSLGIFHGFTVFLSQTFHISWSFIYKFSWFGLFLGLSIFSSIYLLRLVLLPAKFWQQIIAAIIFTTNTYILMVVGGGQMGVALAYSLAPLVLARFIKLVDNFNSVQQNFQFSSRNNRDNFKVAVMAGLALALQIMFDPRIAYLTMIAVGMYYVSGIKYYVSKKNMLNTFYLLLNTTISLGITFLLHAVWILPFLFLGSSFFPKGITSVEGFRFFSFADFSHAFSLNHPNWPENIFGKTYFMKPEFLVLPILAYASLLFLSNSKFQIPNSKQIQNSKFQIQKSFAAQQLNNKTILFFAFLGLVGAFFAKGVNAPFSELNSWIFEYVPGMNLFRDPTKFYLLISISYSVLIPFSIGRIYAWFSSHTKFSIFNFQFSNKPQFFNFQNCFLLFAFCFLLFLIRPAVFGQLGGTFVRFELPVEYVKLKDFLHREPGFFRTLWIPRQHRFSYYSLTNVPVEAEPLFKNSKITDIVNQLHRPETEEYLSKLSIKYIIVPYDPNGEIFVKDRKYDVTQYRDTIVALGKIPWLSRVTGFEKIAVFKIRSISKDLFWLEENGSIIYTTRDLTDYSVSIRINSPQKLIFSESFHPAWQLQLADRVIHADKTDHNLNSFFLNKGTYQGNVVFSADKYYTYGKIISIGTIVLLVIFLLQYTWKKYTIHK